MGLQMGSGSHYTDQLVKEKLPDLLRASWGHSSVPAQILFLSRKAVGKHQSPVQVLLEGGFKTLVRMY